MWSRYLTDRGASTFLIGLGLSLYAVPVIVFAPWGGRLADRYGAVRVATVALCAVVPLTVGYGFLTVPVLITVLAVVEGVPQAIANPAVQAAMLDACEADEVAAGQGLAYSVNQVGAGGAALLGPLVYAASGPEVLFAGVGLLMGAVFAAGAWLSRPAVP
jgi:MFS family permease